MWKEEEIDRPQKWKEKGLGRELSSTGPACWVQGIEFNSQYHPPKGQKKGHMASTLPQRYGSSHRPCIKERVQLCSHKTLFVKINDWPNLACRTYLLSPLPGGQLSLSMKTYHGTNRLTLIGVSNYPSTQGLTLIYTSNWFWIPLKFHS